MAESRSVRQWLIDRRAHRINDEATNRGGLLPLPQLTVFEEIHAAAQSARDLVGAWTLLSAEASGPAPKGFQILEATGRSSAVLMRNDLPKYASNNRTQGAPAQYKATVDGSLAYFGTYPVSLSITHNCHPDDGAQLDVSEARQSAPHDGIAGRRIVGAGEITAQPGDFDKVVR